MPLLRRAIICEELSSLAKQRRGPGPRRRRQQPTVSCTGGGPFCCACSINMNWKQETMGDALAGETVTRSGGGGYSFTDGLAAHSSGLARVWRQRGCQEVGTTTVRGTFKCVVVRTLLYLRCVLNTPCVPTALIAKNLGCNFLPLHDIYTNLQCQQFYIVISE